MPVEDLATVNSEYLIGDWKYLGSYYIENGNHISISETPCKYKANWTFTEKSNQQIQLSMQNFSGDGCSRTHNTIIKNVKIENSALLYFLDDVYYTLKIAKASDNQLILKDKDLVNGVVREIYSQYQRK